MKSDPFRLRSPRIIALAIVVMSCGSRDVRFSCSPTPGCSIDEERFEPPLDIARDAGSASCDADERRCAAESIAAGRGHTCGISPAGELFCWGDDSSGQLGPQPVLQDDTDDVPFVPVLDDAVMVAAGDAHSCAIDSMGAVWCWGRNAEGQVTGLAGDDVTSPTAVESPDARAIAAGGAHSCALIDDGVVCWGHGSHGQAGREVRDDALAVGPVTGTEDAVQITAGTRHSCALLYDGRVLCWGELVDGESGELRAFAEPREVPGLEGVSEIAAGAGFTCALRPAGEVLCWGVNGSGQLGDGSFEPSATPRLVLDLEISLGIAAGGAELDDELVGHACAITRDFFIQCWGRNAEGQLGSVPGEDLPRARVVQGEEGDEEDEPFLPDVTALTLGGFHGCSIDHDGPVLCWGDDSLGQQSSHEPGPAGYPAEVELFSAEY